MEDLPQATVGFDQAVQLFQEEGLEIGIRLTGLSGRSPRFQRKRLFMWVSGSMRLLGNTGIGRVQTFACHFMTIYQPRQFAAVNNRMGLLTSLCVDRACYC